jgi:hypothetical protein
MDIFWYRLFTFGRSPIIVINATERKVGQEYAGLTGAVRTLVDKYKLRVVVDGSPNSLDETLLRTKIELQDGQPPQQVIGSHLCAEIYAAIKLVKDSKTFDKDRLWMQSDILADKDLKRPTPDKVFREVEQDGIPVLIPASNSIGIVLQHSLTKKPTLNELEELLKIKV